MAMRQIQLSPSRSRDSKSTPHKCYLLPIKTNLTHKEKEPLTEGIQNSPPAETVSFPEKKATSQEKTQKATDRNNLDYYSLCIIPVSLLHHSRRPVLIMQKPQPEETPFCSCWLPEYIP